MAPWLSWSLTGRWTADNEKKSEAGPKESEALMVYRLGIELAKIMVLQYSNNESSISIGESVRDEDGISFTSIVVRTNER